MSLNRYPGPDPMQELIAEHETEIERYRRVESRRVGCDIGFEWAVQEWMQSHFPDWKKTQWDWLVAPAVRANYLELASNHFRD